MVRRDMPLSAHRIVNAMPQLLTNIQLRLFMFSFHQNIIKHSIPDFSPYSTLSLLILQPLHFLQRAWGVSSASARRTVAVHAHEKDFDYVNILRKPTLSQEVSHYIIDSDCDPMWHNSLFWAKFTLFDHFRAIKTAGGYQESFELCMRYINHI